MVKANFIIPSWKYWAEPLIAQPLTQLYLATILENEGVDVEITDFRDGPKAVNKADIFLYTVASPDKVEVDNLVKQIKKKFPKSKHIAGGPHPTIVPYDNSEMDSIVLGRGEEALKKIIRTFPNIETAYNEDADGKYPFPKRHFLPDDKIINTHLFKTDEIRSTTAQFSFGCPNGCSFCANYTRGPIKRNSLEDISDEIDYLKETYRVKGLSLQDEIVIPANRKDANDFLGLLKSKDIYWRGQTRALRNTSILKQAKESGLVELSIGMESVSQRVIDMAHKNIKVEDVESTLQACKDYGIKTRLYLLNGLPGEDKYTVPKTIGFIEKNKPDLVLLSSLQPYPGSPIEQNPEAYGIQNISKKYDEFNHLLCRFNDSKDDPARAVPYSFKPGKGLSRTKIIDNLLNLQSYLRGRGANK